MTTLQRNSETGELERTDRHATFLNRRPRKTYADVKCSRCGLTPHFHGVSEGLWMVAHPFKMGPEI